MEQSVEQYLITVRLSSGELKEVPVASYWMAASQETAFLEWVEKLCWRLDFSIHNWDNQLHYQLQTMADFFSATGKVAAGGFPFESYQMQLMNVYRIEAGKDPVLLRSVPVKPGAEHLPVEKYRI